MERWLAEVRVDEAARGRASVADRRRRRAEDATLAGVLVDLAVRGDAVTVVLRSGRLHRGRVRLVGPDAVVMALDTHQWLVVRLAAVAAVRTVQAEPVPGDAEPSTASRFARLAGVLAEPGDRVHVASGTVTQSGSVDAVGAETLTLRLDNDDVAYVSLAAADEVSVRRIT